MGTSTLGGMASGYFKDHPHAYGDKSVCASVRLSLPGSSPRVWGQAALVSSAIAAPGIIPTRMGTSVLVKDIADLG